MPASSLNPRLSASIGTSGVTLTWTADPRATGYHVERSAAANGNFERLTHEPVASPWTDPHLSRALSWYRVVPVYADGGGEPSAAVQASLPWLFAPVGAPMDRDALLALALLTAADLDDADDLWRSHTPRSYAGVLSGDGWRWDGERQLYVSDHGTPLKDAALQGIVTVLISSVAEDLKREATRMATGETPVARWEADTADTLRGLYAATLAAGYGGVGNVTPDALARLSGSSSDPVPPSKANPPTLAFSLDRLDRFARAAADGQPGADSVPSVANRSTLYADMGYTVLEDVRRECHREAKDASGRALYQYERSILDPGADHCTSDEFEDGCVEVAEAGWAPIGTLTPIGCRQCGPKCRCRMSYVLLPPEMAGLN